MSAVAICLRDVAVSYREDVALKGVSLEIKSGEMIGIAGPNGAGKTTILTVINGLGRLMHGEVRVLGYHMKAGPRGRDFRLSLRVARLRKMIGYVPQGCSIDPRVPIHVREAVMMGRYGRFGLWGRPGKKDWEKVDRLLEMVGISHLAGRPLGHLSGGEQQRVAIARALAQEPRILLLDEPTTFLDWRSQREILHLIGHIHREHGLTTLMVTHDPRESFDICDRVVLLKRGRVTAVGPPGEVLSDANLRAVYGESPLCCRGGHHH
ncbi:MAG: metal ABC transporter ATP-binding protein [Peptococcaceae bacterium]|nr:metal ABC transporter ATP-binding protein [Peptococcaceae bacterium]